jgi:HEAT repeat protein
MSRPRKAMVWPLLYAALLAWGLVKLYSGVEFVTPRVKSWLEQRRIVAWMRSPDVQTRRQVVLSLEHQNLGFAKPFLLEAVNDPSFEVSIAACHLLVNQRADPRRLIPVLSAAAGDDDTELRVETAGILGRILALLAGEIRSSADTQASPAAQLRSESVTILYRLFKDRVPEVRAAAADSLGEGGLDSSVAAELIAAAGDPDRSVRLGVARALLRINGPGDRTAAGILTGLVTDREPIGDRSLALKALLQASEETQNQALLAMVELLFRADPLIQPDVLDCLAEAGPHALVALPALKKLLDDPEPGTRAAAARALLQIEANWNHPEAGIAGMAASAIASNPGSEVSKNPRLIAVMLEIIADKTLAEKWRMDILGRIKETVPTALPKATEGLIRQLGDGNSNVRRAALDLLSSIIEDTPAQMPNHADVR